MSSRRAGSADNVVYDCSFIEKMKKKPISIGVMRVFNLTDVSLLAVPLIVFSLCRN